MIDPKVRLPQSLKRLSFGEKFDRPVDHLPQSLEARAAVLFFFFGGGGVSGCYWGGVFWVASWVLDTLAN